MALLTLLGVAATAEYTVQAGDTLTGIAARHGTTAGAIAEANDVADPNWILAGRTLRIPVDEAAAGAGDHGTGADAGISSRAGVEALLERTAVEHGWNPAFVKAVAWQESGWRNDVVSHAGAVGIMQVMPGTGGFVSRNLAGRELDLYDPEDNVLAGVLFLDYLYGLTGGDAERTLAGYYQGLASVGRHGKFDDTKQYIANVLSLRERFR